jgi:hypothetical protein
VFHELKAEGDNPKSKLNKSKITLSRRKTICLSLSNTCYPDSVFPPFGCLDLNDKASAIMPVGTGAPTLLANGATFPTAAHDTAGQPRGASIRDWIGRELEKLLFPSRLVKVTRLGCR